MSQLTTSFNRVRLIRSNEPLTDAEIRRVAPSVFANTAYGACSERYTHIPTYEVLAALRREGFQPFMACQARTRLASREGYVKHMLRLRHQAQITGCAANEIILVNSHDGRSLYQMLGGVYVFVCHNGLVTGATVEDLRVPHRGNVIDHVIEGAHRILGDFERVNASREAMRARSLDIEERHAFAQAALRLRWPTDEVVPVTVEQVLTPRRFADVGQDLWTTFNVLQENLIRGGLCGRSLKGKRTTTRPIQAIDRNIALNRALWTLAEGMLTPESA